MENFRRRVYNEINIQRLLCSEFVPILYNYYDCVSRGRIHIAMEHLLISLDRLIHYKKEAKQIIPLYVIQRV